MFEIGTSLRDARLRQGYELADAEAATKIRSKYLGALEEERFELLPAQTYVKGFLHAYAEYLGLDGQLYVDEYNSRYVAGEDEPGPRPQRRPAVSRAHRRHESRMVVLALLGITALTALVVIAWNAGEGERQPIPNLDAARPPAAADATQPAATATAQRPRPAALSIAAVRGSSSLTVNKGTATGELVYAGTLEQGKSLRFTWRQLWIQASNPENLRVRLNGRAVQLSSDPSAPATVIVTADGIRPAGED